MPQSPNPPCERLALTASDVAMLLGISRAHVWRLNAAYQLPEPIRLGKSVRWPRAEIEAWLAAGAPSRPVWERHTMPLFRQHEPQGQEQRPEELRSESA